MRRPWSSKTSSPSRSVSNASAYWKPEQPPPRTPTRRFSARTVAALDALGREFAAVDVLPDPRIRQELSALSNWPTIPQLFVRGELVGGCDIVTEMYESGELAQVMGVEQPSDAPAEAPAAQPGPQ